MAKTETPVHCWVCDEPMLADDDGNIESGGIWNDDCHGYMMCHKECAPDASIGDWEVLYFDGVPDFHMLCGPDGKVTIIED